MSRLPTFRWFLLAAGLVALSATDRTRAQALGAPTRVLIVFDLSYSMRERLGGISRIEAARRAFKDALSDLPAGTELGLRLVAHVGNRDEQAACHETALTDAIGAGTHDRIARTVIDSRPIGRKTPLAFALEQAKADLAAVRGPKKVLLLSDGLDTCDGDPSRAAADLRGTGAQVDVIAIGTEGVKQLGRAALAGGGRFALATNLDVLKDALRLGLRWGVPPPVTRAGPAAPAGGTGAGSDASMHVEIILDSSGSMAAQQQGRAKIAIAKDALAEAVTALAGPQIKIAFRAYGFDSRVPKVKDTSCRNTELLVGFEGGGPRAIADKARALEAYGYTPIATSLRLGGEDLRPFKDRRPTILLISDGEETCDGDPVAEIRKLRASGVAVQVHVIGFDLNAKARAQMMAIARAGRGRYDHARDPSALLTTLKARAAALRAQASSTPARARVPMPRPYPATPGASVPTVLEAYFTEMRRVFPPSEGNVPASSMFAGGAFWKLASRDVKVPSMGSAMLFSVYRPSAWKIASVEESGDFAMARIEFTVGSPLQLRLKKDPFVRRAEYALVRDGTNWHLADFQELNAPAQTR